MTASAAAAASAATAITAAPAAIASAAAASAMRPTTAVAAWRTAFAATIMLTVEARLFHIGSLVATFEGYRAASFAFRRRLGSAHLGALLFQDGLARQLDAVAFDSQHLHQDLVAFFQFVANVVNAVLGDFADVQQAVGSGNDLDECAEISQPRDLAQIGLAYLGRRRDVADHLQRLGRRHLIARRNVDLAAVFDIDLDAGLLR